MILCILSKLEFQKKMQNEIDQQGYAFIDAENDREIINMVSSLSKNKLELSRSVVISSHGKGDLASSNEEFYYHTDATFQRIPPKYIALQLLAPCDGGEIRIFDSEHILKNFKNERYFFGNQDRGIKAYLYEKSPEDSYIFRYRKDYMRPLSNPSALNSLHNQIIHTTLKHSVSLGYIPLGKILVINNWKFLHMRGSFREERTVRRLWFDYVDNKFKLFWKNKCF